VAGSGTRTSVKQRIVEQWPAPNERYFVTNRTHAENMHNATQSKTRQWQGHSRDHPFSATTSEAEVVLPAACVLRIASLSPFPRDMLLQCHIRWPVGAFRSLWQIGKVAPHT
jgi:hypothetical protein